MIDDSVLALIRSSIKSVWALEILLLLRRHAGRVWSTDELVRELRGSRLIVNEALPDLRAAGLVAAESGDAFRYAPATPELDRTVELLEQANAERPMAVVKAIVTAPNDKLQTFADAFRLKKD